MKYFTVLAVCVLLCATLFGSSSATSEPVCGYTNSKGELIFLHFIYARNKGEEYLDIDENNNCVKRVECLEDYTLKIEDC